MKQTIAKRLKQIREDNGLTQEELARAIGTSKHTIMRYENEETVLNVSMLEKLEKYFGVSLWQECPVDPVSAVLSRLNAPLIKWLLGVDEDVLFRIETLCRVAGLYSEGTGETAQPAGRKKHLPRFNDTSCNSLGSRIQRIRRAEKLTQDEFGSALHITVAHISKIEAGKAVPSDLLLSAICFTFQINEHWLRTGDGHMTYTNELTLEQSEQGEKFMYQILAERLKNAREKRGLSQEELADAIGCCSQTIYRFEKGKRIPKRALMEKLEQYFGFSLWE